MRSRDGWFVAPVLGLAVSHAAAGIVAYDTITNYSATQFQVATAAPVQGDDTALDPGAGLVISRVSLLARLRSGASFAQFDGTLTLRLYAAAANGYPGTLLHEATLPVLIDRGTDQVVSFDIPGVVAPSANIWTTWYFAQGQNLAFYSDVWVRQSTAAPAPGSTTDLKIAGTPTTPPSQWQPSSDPDRNYAIRIETVPAPAGLSVAAAALAGVVARRRR